MKLPLIVHIYQSPRGTHRIVQQQHRNDQLPCHSRWVDVRSSTSDETVCSPQTSSRPSRYTSSCTSLSSGLLQLHRAHTRTRADVEFFLGPNLSNLSASSLLSNERRVFLLIGIGGCGKTQLARKFMKRVYQRCVTSTQGSAKLSGVILMLVSQIL